MYKEFVYEILLLACCGVGVESQDSTRNYSYPMVPTANYEPSATSDGWEKWSEWTPCSRTCGGGVTEQRRNCRIQTQKNPSVAPDWSCNGSNKKFSSCNTQPCPDGFVNSRRAKCAEYNSRAFAGNTYAWEPMSRGGPCELSCRALGHRFFVRHSSRVTDGTDCSFSLTGHNVPIQGTEAPKHICIEGRCLVTM